VLRSTVKFPYPDIWVVDPAAVEFSIQRKSISRVPTGSVLEVLEVLEEDCEKEDDEDDWEELEEMVGDELELLEADE